MPPSTKDKFKLELWLGYWLNHKLNKHNIDSNCAKLLVLVQTNHENCTIRAIQSPQI